MKQGDEPSRNGCAWRLSGSRVCELVVEWRMFDFYGLIALVLLVIGLGVLVTEVFVPSGGALAIITTLTLFLALAFAYVAWFERYPSLWWGFCVLELAAIPVTLGGSFYVLPNTRLGRKMLLEAPDADQLEPHAEESARLAQLVGKYGRTLTVLMPGGLVEVEGSRLHAFSEGQVVDLGKSVLILEARGTRVLVRPAEPPSSAPEGHPKTSPLDSRVDFDLPTE